MNEHNQSGNILKDYIFPFIKDVIIPIVVGISSVSVAMSANKIATQQALIAKNSELPTIKVSDCFYSGDVTGAAKNQLEISILDGKYFNYESETIVFLVFSFEGTTEDGYWSSFDKVELPIFDYYDGRSYGGHELYGCIETIENTDLHYVNDFRTNVESYYNNQNSPKTLIILRQSYIKISYINLMGEKEVVYYVAGDRIDWPKQLSNELGEKKFEKYKTMGEAELWVGFTTPVHQVFQIIDTINETENSYKDDIEV